MLLSPKGTKWLQPVQTKLKLGKKRNGSSCQETGSLSGFLLGRKETDLILQFDVSGAELGHWECLAGSRALAVISALSSLPNTLPLRNTPEGIFLLAFRLPCCIPKRYVNYKGKIN